MQLGILCPGEHAWALRRMEQLVDVLTYVDRYAWAFENEGADAAKTKRYAERLLYEARRFTMQTTPGEAPLPPWPKKKGSAGAFLARQMRAARPRRSGDERQLPMFVGDAGDFIAGDGLKRALDARSPSPA